MMKLKSIKILFALPILCFCTGNGFAQKTEEKITFDDLVRYFRDSLAEDIDPNDNSAVRITEDPEELQLLIGKEGRGKQLMDVRFRLCYIKSVTAREKTVRIEGEEERTDAAWLGGRPMKITRFDGNIWHDDEYPWAIELDAKSPEDAKRVVKALRYLMERFNNVYLLKEKNALERKRALDKALDGK